MVWVQAIRRTLSPHMNLPGLWDLHRRVSSWSHCHHKHIWLCHERGPSLFSLRSLGSLPPFYPSADHSRPASSATSFNLLPFPPSLLPSCISKFGRTEVIDNTLNPDFVRKFVLDYYFEEKQNLRFDVWVDPASLFNLCSSPYPFSCTAALLFVSSELVNIGRQAFLITVLVAGSSRTIKKCNGLYWSVSTSRF